MNTEESQASLRERIKHEIRKALAKRDDWLLIHLSVKPNGVISLGSDTIFHGFENSRELRGPRWRSFHNVRQFADQGYSWIVAGELSAQVLFHHLKAGNVPPGIIMHALAVERWAPECATLTQVLNSVRGFLNPTLPENKPFGSRRPGRSTRARLKDHPCRICGGAQELTLHHLIPRVIGGATEEENLLNVCRPCHDSIHNGTLDINDLVMQLSVERMRHTLNAISGADANPPSKPSNAANPPFA